jgi:hypothetical protein
MGFCHNSPYRHGVYYDEKVSLRLEGYLFLGHFDVEVCICSRNIFSLTPNILLIYF